MGLTELVHVACGKPALLYDRPERYAMLMPSRAFKLDGVTPFGSAGELVVCCSCGGLVAGGTDVTIGKTVHTGGGTPES